MTTESILKIIANGAWNGGTVVDNTVFENKGLAFKNNIPVTGKTIEQRIGVRTRVAAPEDTRIGSIALQDLLDTSNLDPGRIKLLIGATNVGDDKYDHGPLIRFPLETAGTTCPHVRAFDLYAGCPGFNVAVELIFMLSLGGILQKDDISVIVGAENIHRAKAFREGDTASIIFGDDALATALETTATLKPEGDYSTTETLTVPLGREDFVEGAAAAIFQLNGHDHIDGLIFDNQTGNIIHRVPATAARVQHRLTELMHPERAANGTFRKFREALGFYNEHVNSFAFDIMSLDKDPGFVAQIARAYVHSGKYRTVVSAFLSSDQKLEVTVHRGRRFIFIQPKTGIVDTATSTHGCFGGFIEAVADGNEVFGEMDGKGVFLYATRGAKKHLGRLLSTNGITINDIDLLIEHQANFAMIPMTLEQLLTGGVQDVKPAAVEFLADKMVTNVHVRGNCSVVCMQRLPYDLQVGALKEDIIQGFPVNRNLDQLRSAKTILNDSVGAGMTRSSFLQRLA